MEFRAAALHLTVGSREEEVVQQSEEEAEVGATEAAAAAWTALPGGNPGRAPGDPEGL